MEIAQALKVTRYESGKSQEYMALELGIARRTVQNWESGVSQPTIGQLMDWFQLVHKNPVPYLLQYLFPDMEPIREKEDDEKLRKELIQLLQDMPGDGIRQLLYLLCGDHGSSPRAIMQLITAHLQTPMKDRVTQAGVIIHNYDIASKKGTLVNPKRIQPDLLFLKEALKAGEEAVIKDEKEYTMQQKEME